MRFQRFADAFQRGERIRHRFFHRRQLAALAFAHFFGDRLRRTNARHHVLALRIDQKFAVKQVLTGGGIARERNAGGRCLAAIAEHHGLHIDRGAPVLRNVMQTAIGVGARTLPRSEHRPDRTPQLRFHIIGERRAQILLHPILIGLRDTLQIGGIQFGVEFDALLFLDGVENFLEQRVLHAQYHVRIHLNETAITVIGETRIAGQPGKAFGRLLRQAEVQHRVHHAGHRNPRAGSHRNQQRLLRIAEFGAGQFADLRHRLLHRRLQFGGIALAVGIIMGADFGGDGEAGRHGQAQIAHLGQVRPLAAEQILHPGLAFRGAVTKRIDPFAHIKFAPYARLLAGAHCFMLQCSRVKPPMLFA